MLVWRLPPRLSERRDSRSVPAAVSQSELQGSAAALQALAFAMLHFARLRLLLAAISPSGHRWQCPQSILFPQPSGFQNQVQGLHLPVPCSSDPWLGIPHGGGKPGGGLTPLMSSFVVSFALAFAAGIFTISCDHSPIGSGPSSSPRLSGEDATISIL